MRGSLSLAFYRWHRPFLAKYHYIIYNKWCQWMDSKTWIDPVLCLINTLRPRQLGRHFLDDIFKYIFLNDNLWILIKISLKFVPEGTINNIPALVQIMAWRRLGDKPFSEPMMARLPTHICVRIYASLGPNELNICIFVVRKDFQVTYLTIKQLILSILRGKILPILSFSWLLQINA